MLIDWFTVIAQIINFLILVFLLWRFLYKPINQTMEERQRRITNRWQEAQRKQEEAEEEARLYRQQQQELKQNTAKLMDEARAKAEEEREKLIQAARKEVDLMRAGWQETIRGEQNEFLRSLRERLQTQTSMIARRVLQDLANTKLEERVIAVFLQRLRELDEGQVRELIQQPAREIIIYSSFEIPQAQRQEFIHVLRCQKIIQGLEISFKTTPDLICGINLQWASYQISWNFADYLESLTEKFSQFFQHEG